jgi:hypothetical protein
MVARVFWCNFCNQRPRSGQVTVVREGEDEPVTLDACAVCARKLFDDQEHDLVQ